MHTLKFSAQTEQTLKKLAAFNNQTPDELLQHLVAETLQKQAYQLILSSNVANNKKQQDRQSAVKWDQFFYQFSQRQVDASTYSREEIYAERLR